MWYVAYDPILDNYTVHNWSEKYVFQTQEWAELCCNHFNALDRITQPNFLTTVSVANTSTVAPITSWAVHIPEYSEWICHMFGSDSLSYRPKKGEEPNWFWRKMQYWAFGNRWVKQ